MANSLSTPTQNVSKRVTSHDVEVWDRLHLLQFYSPCMSLPRFWRPWMLEADGPAWIRNCLAARGFKPEVCKARVPLAREAFEIFAAFNLASPCAAHHFGTEIIGCPSKSAHPGRCIIPWLGSLCGSGSSESTCGVPVLLRFGSFVLHAQQLRHMQVCKVAAFSSSKWHGETAKLGEKACRQCSAAIMHFAASLAFF